MAGRVSFLVSSRRDLQPSLRSTRCLDTSPQHPSRGSWECGIRPGVATLLPGGEGTGQEALRVCLFGRDCTGFAEEGGSALTEWRIQWAGFHLAW